MGARKPRTRPQNTLLFTRRVSYITGHRFSPTLHAGTALTAWLMGRLKSTDCREGLRGGRSPVAAGRLWENSSHFKNQRPLADRCLLWRLPVDITGGLTTCTRSDTHSNVWLMKTFSYIMFVEVFTVQTFRLKSSHFSFSLFVFSAVGLTFKIPQDTQFWHIKVTTFMIKIDFSSQLSKQDIIRDALVE